jgi:hypothetical protein
LRVLLPEEQERRPLLLQPACCNGPADDHRNDGCAISDDSWRRACVGCDASFSRVREPLVRAARDRVEAILPADSAGRPRPASDSTLRRDRCRARHERVHLELPLRSGKTPWKSKHGLSAQRINHVMGVLRRVLEDAADRFHFTSPYQRIKPLKLTKSDVEPFSLAEVQRRRKSAVLHFAFGHNPVSLFSRRDRTLAPRRQVRVPSARRDGRLPAARRRARPPKAVGGSSARIRNPSNSSNLRGVG